MSTDLFGHRALVDSGERSAFDWYPTPDFFTRSLVYHVPEIEQANVFECASGDDDIVSVLVDEFRCRVLTNDIDRSHVLARWHHDATEPYVWQIAASFPFNNGRPLEWVCTNPPFNLAFEMLKHAVEHASIGVAFLLRKTFLEPTEERGEWLSKHPPSRIIGLPRHNFRGDGVDSVSCDWMIWEKHPNKHAYPIEIDHLAKSRGKGSA